MSKRQGAEMGTNVNDVPEEHRELWKAGVSRSSYPEQEERERIARWRQAADAFEVKLAQSFFEKMKARQAEVEGAAPEALTLDATRDPPVATYSVEGGYGSSINLRVDLSSEGYHGNATLWCSMQVKPEGGWRGFKPVRVSGEHLDVITGDISKFEKKLAKWAPLVFDALRSRAHRSRADAHSNSRSVILVDRFRGLLTDLMAPGARNMVDVEVTAGKAPDELSRVAFKLKESPNDPYPEERMTFSFVDSNVEQVTKTFLELRSKYLALQREMEAACCVLKTKAARR